MRKGESMTVETDLLRAMATLKSIHADLRTLWLRHPDPTARAVFGKEAGRTTTMLRAIEARLDEIRDEEEDYGRVTSGKEESKPIGKERRGQ